jgi:hypothetical protein
MKRCQWRGANTHSTRDQVSHGAMKSLQVAAFPAGHSAVCNCSASEGKMKPEDCDGLCVYDGDNSEVARFTGKHFRAQQGEDGGILVYAMPTAQTQDHTDVAVIDRDMSAHAKRLAGINRANDDFWAPA